MSKNDEQILANELARLGGSVLTNGVATFLPTDTYEISFQMATQSTAVMGVAATILKTEGELLSTEEIPPLFEVKGMVGAGFLDMNPALVNISITVLSPLRAHVRIQGKAKEGLIKQHAGKKATQRVAHLLLSQLREMN
ncbi:MAG TPA: hypothetical protein VFV38_52290 [Ktedonobacteraceae bacterium]|nr:hypothetical protein [Ktedonobacteraceae bacterium]